MQSQVPLQRLDDEFTFHSYTQDRPRKINLTIFLGAIGISMAQLMLCFQIHETGFRKLAWIFLSTVLLGILSAFLAGRWVNKKIWDRENIVTLSFARKNVRDEYITLLFCLISFGIALILCLNLDLIDDYLGDYLTALNFDEKKWTEMYGKRDLEDVKGFLSMIISSYRIFEAVIGVYFAVMCKLILDSLMDIVGTNTLLVDFTHAIVCFLGLVVYFAGRKIKELKLFYHTGDLELEIDPIKFIGIFFFVFGACSWVIIRRKWKIPMILFIILGLIGICSGFFFILSMQKDMNKKLSSKDIPGENTLQAIALVSVIPKTEFYDILNIEKYNDSDDCPDYLKVKNWETRNDDIKCLNPESLKILSYYSLRYYVILSTFVLYLLICNCFLALESFKYLQEPYLLFEMDSSRCLLCSFIGVCMVFSIGMSNLKLEPALMNSALIPEIQIENFVAKNQELASMVFIKPIIGEQYYETFDDMWTKYDIYNFIVFKANKYMILRQSMIPSKPPYIYSTGSKDAHYEDMMHELNSLNHALCLIWLDVEHIKRLIIIRYVNDKTQPEIARGYPDTVSNPQDFGFIKADNMESLEIEKVLQSVKGIFAMKRWEKEILGVDDLTRKYNLAQDIQLPTSLIIKRDGEPKDPIQNFFWKFTELKENSTYKYLTCVFKDAIKVEKVGLNDSNFLNFLDALEHPNLKLGILDFRYETKHQPIAILWEHKIMNDEVRKNLNYTLDWLINQTIPLMIPENLSELDLNFMVENGAQADPEIRKKKSREVKDKILHF